MIVNVFAIVIVFMAGFLAGVVVEHRYWVRRRLRRRR
jgi:hypothetical protein